MASIPSNSSDDECVGPPKKSKRPKKRSKNKSKAKDPKTTPPCPGNHAAKADASAAAQAPATGEPGASLEEPVDRASRGKTCVFVCLVDVACSEESPQCSTKVFLAGSYWCQFDFACPPFEPAFTVTYIPYKPPDAPTSTGSQMVIVEPPGPAASPVMADVTITASTAMPPTAAPGAAAPPGTDKNVSAGATALTTPGPIVTPVTVEGGPTPQEPGSPPGMPPATVRSGQGASSRPRKPPAPQCFYVCQREVCSADTCEVVEGSDFCTFWAMCPANPPASRVIYLPQDAETDPPGTVIAAAGAQTPEPLPGLNPAAAPGPVMQKRIGG
ncbi:unnamed protein product [Ostreobium quekettii]|uniref:Uncharacterized protein n=1 Tax=Ostreobium quekettii TaxID=121088 RepID=A0A8S1IRE0_9CHLO|nr:unnamed protein product [Ostreobium quekettii]